MTPRKCKRNRHPVDSDRCFLCEQEDREQEERDDRLCEAVGRLIARGKLRVIWEVEIDDASGASERRLSLEAR